MEGIIEIHGEIGERVTLETVKSQINEKATSHTVYLNSEGGEVNEGIKIYHLLNNLPNVTVVVEGLAASIATLIMQAGKKIIALRPSQIMIHNPFGQMQGEEKDMMDAAAQLKRVKSIIISVYKKRPKLAALSEPQLAAMMDNATWMDADEALNAGFVDEVRDKLRAVAKLDLNKIKMEENKEVAGMFEKLSKQFETFMASFNSKGVKAKNIIAETLESGGEIQIQAAEGEDWVGKTATVDGAPAAPGEYPLATGETIVIGEGSIVSTVKEPAMDNNKELAEAKAQIEALKKELEMKGTEAAAAQKSANDAVAAVANMKTEFLAFKNSVGKEVFGENGKPVVKFHNHEKEEEETAFHRVFMDFHEHAIEVFKYANRNIQ